MEKYGSFKNLAGDKKGMSAEEAYIMLKNLGLLGQEFVPGATSLRKLMEGKPREAIDELQDWIPGNAAYQNFISGKDQDWGRNAIDLATVGIPLAKGAKKAAAAIEKMPKGGKEGFIQYKRIPNNDRTVELGEQFKNDLMSQVPNGYHLSDTKKHISSTLRENGIISKPKNWETLGTEERARWITKNLAEHDTWDNVFPANGRELYFKSHPEFLDAQDYAEFANYLEHRPQLQMEVYNAKYGDETSKFINGGKPTYSEKPTINMGDLSTTTERMIGDPTAETLAEYPSQAELLSEKQKQKQILDQQKAERKAAEQAAKEAKWKAEREAAAKAAEEKRLAKEAEERRIAEEAEKQRLAEEAEAKSMVDEEARKRAEEEEFERQFREEEGAERNRYADSLANVASREAVDNDINEWLYNKMLEDEKVNPVTSMDQFTGESFGGTPTISNPTAPATGKTRPSYDHSREFNGGTFQILDPIDRGTLTGNGDLGERIFDAQSKFYTPTVRPGENIRTTSTGRVFNKVFPKSKVMDPYNEAGVINDMNIKLNRLIDRERKLGFTDEEIYRKFKPEFDEYQGKIDRYKTRLNNPESDFYYDGAQTNNIVATPSEEINVLRSLGLQNDVNPRMGEIMDKTRDHYQDLMKRIYQYESQFSQTPKLSTEQFKRLKDMGIRPEDIDMYLAEHPEFF